MAGLLWHKVSEKEKKDIEKQAKSIMENFSKKLDKVKGKVKDSGAEREQFEREEGEREEGKKEDQSKDFRERMFENAPNKNKDFIIAEKKEW